MNSSFKRQIDTDAETLWQLLTDPDHTRHWMPEVESIQPRDPMAGGVGTISDMKIREGKKLVDYEEEITAWTPGAHLGLVLRGGNLGDSPMQLDYRLQPTQDGVELQYTGQWAPTEWHLRLLGPLISWIGRRHGCKTLDRLEAYARTVKTT